METTVLRYDMMQKPYATNVSSFAYELRRIVQFLHHHRLSYHNAARWFPGHAIYITLLLTCRVLWLIRISVFILELFCEARC